ncbi:MULTISPECIES: alpha/beta hydrolase [Halomonas]|uniref:alpha/beta hydrolase n=1 Tax=Halomonas TaxID=2745 RepID=UPI001C941D8F|nr:MULTISPECIES: alpha/beta hydrolase [Halomonas]MBY6209279.1 alpha/beta hydrolase [Halomonas sp. DP3Y7-2]MBY6229434.1 alpha/beta hydrolase [Halomonas sp. DP3Y7-1]MCA0917503.1 alpha/beta hydrolase [Halomonas denitrificans]
MHESNPKTKDAEYVVTRRSVIQGAVLAAGSAALLGYPAAPAAASSRPNATSGTDEATGLSLTQEWDKTFPRSENVDHRKVTFKNRYGITLAADLYQPKNKSGRLAAISVSGPFGAVKEQSSGLYAQTMAERGFVALAFDPSFTGESGGEPRNVASPDINTEDVSASVDFLGLLPSVDRNRIGAIGICGYSGMALTAATSDSRIKAVATVSMYDMSRSMSRSYKDSYTREQRHQVIDYLSQQRWVDAENGSYGLGYHEVPFDENGNIIKGQRVLPESLPENPDPVLAAFFDYYRTPRGFHPRGINSTTAWTATTPMSFFSFPLYANIDMMSARPILLVAGENAHSRYYSEDVNRVAYEPKELVIVPKADHVDLYDQLDRIPFDTLTSFFDTHLSST